MKPPVLIALTIMATALGGCSDASLTNPLADWTAELRVGFDPAPGLVRSNANGLMKSDAAWQLPAAWRVQRDGPPAFASPLQPGVYRAEPYSVIVVVPGAHPDDRCIMGGYGARSPMRIIQPELKLIPVTMMRETNDSFEK
jgi:hypothetical protein